MYSRYTSATAETFIKMTYKGRNDRGIKQNQVILILCRHVPHVRHLETSVPVKYCSSMNIKANCCQDPIPAWALAKQWAGKRKFLEHDPLHLKIRFWLDLDYTLCWSATRSHRLNCVCWFNCLCWDGSTLSSSTKWGSFNFISNVQIRIYWQVW